MPTILYYLPESPPARAVIFLTRYMGLKDIELKVINTLAGENHDPKFVKINPQKTIPFLDDNGFYLAESSAILNYLVETRNGDLVGRTPKTRALVQHRLFYLVGTVWPSAIPIFGPVLRAGATVVPSEPKEKLFETLKVVNGFLEKSTYIVENSITIADFAYLSVISSLIHSGFNIKTRFPNIWAWYQRCSTLEGYSGNEDGAKSLGSIFKSKLTEPVDN